MLFIVMHHASHSMPYSGESSVWPSLAPCLFALSHSLVLASLGLPNDVITTDIEPALSLVLAPNVARNQPPHSAEREAGGWVDVRPLDWMDPVGSTSGWLGVDPEGAAAAASTSMPSSLTAAGRADGSASGPTAFSPTRSRADRGEWECIITTDTVYAPSLVDPLLRTLRWLSQPAPSPPPSLATQESSSQAATPARSRPRRHHRRPDIFVAIEGRDPTLVTHAVERAKAFRFKCSRVNEARVEACVQRAGWGWSLDGDEHERSEDEERDRGDEHGGDVRREDWDGIEIWKWTLSDDVDDDARLDDKTNP